jgi:hypothetical protein
MCDSVSRIRLHERLEEDTILGQEISSQARLLVDDLLLELGGTADHLIGVIDPVRIARHPR